MDQTTNNCDRNSSAKAPEEAQKLTDKVETVNGDDEPMGPRWKPGDRVYAVWAGNGCYYAATVSEVHAANNSLTVQWDDADNSHREVSFDKVMEPSEDTAAWATSKIDRRASVFRTREKGRCLFTNEACEPGQVVFIERPTLVALPALLPKLWEHLQQLHEAKPLNLGTVTFHFAALLSQLKLDPMSIDVILDKFVPDPDEDPGEDVLRIIQSLQDSSMQDVLNLREHPIDPRKLQRLVSAWRYNSFGHHKEDGLVLYNRISMCAHSCDPSCCWSYGDDDAFVLRARVALNRGDELTISYLQDEDLLKSTAVRQQKLQNWRFTCQCPRCCLRVDMGRGFRCRRCRIGILYASVTGGLEPCRVCSTSPSQEDMGMLLHLEEEYVLRVETLDRTDVADVETVYQYRQPSTSLSAIGSYMSWTPCCGKLIVKRISLMLLNISDAASNSMSTTTAGQPSSSLGATRSLATVCRISSSTAGGNTYRNFRGRTRCLQSCVAPATNTPQARITSFGRQAVPAAAMLQLLPTMLTLTPSSLERQPLSMIQV